MANPLSDWLMARGALRKAGGVEPYNFQPSSTDPTYLQQQVALNPNNYPGGKLPTPPKPAVNPLGALANSAAGVPAAAPLPASTPFQRMMKLLGLGGQ